MRTRVRTGGQCAGNEGRTLDPQRQHARLLGLWGQAVKASRRQAHRGSDIVSPEWLGLAATWTARDYLFQFVPATTVVVALVEPGRLLLTGAATASEVRQDWRWPVWGIEGDGPALVLGAGSGSLSWTLARRLGRRAWEALGATAAELQAHDPLAIMGVDDAVGVLAAWSRGVLDSRERGKWVEASYRWRQGAPGGGRG